MSKVTKLYPGRIPDSDLLDETLGKFAVEAGFKLPETEAELKIYECRLISKGIKCHSRYGSIHEALADAEKTKEVKYKEITSSNSQGTYELAARNGGDIDTETLDMMDAVADEDDDD